jgi:hypothetical protein
MADKAKILEGLQHVQTLLYDSRSAIGEVIVNRPIKLTLAGVHDRLVQSEEILEKILDLEFWN